MELWLILVMLAVLVVALAIGAVVLLKLGVVAHYLAKPENPQDELGDYDLNESREVRPEED